MASPVQWENVYIDNFASAHYRKSETNSTLLSAMAAWLRVGELKVREMKLPVFDKAKFKQALITIRKMVACPPADFPVQIQNLSGEAGVAVVYSISIPKAPISGAARWIGGKPVIQITDRYKTNDHFWFTFFHEAGHILLHGKKDVFIEDFEGVVNDEEKEQEANDFARDYLLPDSFLTEIGEQKVTETLVKRTAKQFDTHPGVVVGRLQHLQLVPYTFGNNLKSKVYLNRFMT